MMRCAVFASGSGSNFQVLAEAFQDSDSVDLALLFADQPNAYALERAEKLGIDHKTFSPKDFESRHAYEEALVELCQSYDIDIILLAGYMRIINQPLLQAFPNRIVNIHPSLLPAFPGRDGIGDAFAAGVEETGVTVHFIDDGIDTGPIIRQERVAIYPEDRLEDLQERIHKVEHRIYPEVVQELSQRSEYNG